MHRQASAEKDNPVRRMHRDYDEDWDTTVPVRDGAAEVQRAFVPTTLGVGFWVGNLGCGIGVWVAGWF